MKVISNGKTAILGGSEIPPGGLPGQVLIKASDSDFDTEWGDYADISNPPPPTYIYGIEWDGAENSPIVRTDDAALYPDPVAAEGDSEGSSPFDNLMPWSGMLKVLQDGNEMVAIPKYWLKVQSNPFRVQISSLPQEGFQVSPAHRDRGDGQGERDVVYIGRYECDANFKSTSGQTPKVNTKLSDFRSGIHALGDEYWPVDYALQLTWWYLYLVEFANWDGQASVGQGNVKSSESIVTGGTDSMVYHTGSATGEAKKTAVQYRGIENLWGNVNEWRDGFVVTLGGTIITYNNPSNFVSVYNGVDPTTRTNSFDVDFDFFKNWSHDESDPSFIFPTENANYSFGYIPDAAECKAKTNTLLYVGGYYQDEHDAGPFCIHVMYSDTTRNNVGSRIQKLPNN